MTMRLKDLTLRIGLASTGLILFAVSNELWVQGQPFRPPLALSFSVIAWVVGITLLVLALVTHIDSQLAWFVLVGLLFAQLAYAYLQRLNCSPLTAVHTDNEMIAQFAVQALKRGQNPYAWNFSDMLRVFRDQKSLTPFLDGAFQYRLTYPILPTLVLTGFDLFGIGDVKTVSLIFHLALLVLVFVGAPARFRPIVLLPLFLSRGFILLTLNGVQDVAWSALLVGVILTWKRPVWRAVLFGLAASYRQQPWFVAPFLLIYMWNEPGTAAERRRRIANFVAISVGVFFLVNLPFILWDPRAWLLGTLEPAYASFNVHSHGLGVISQYGLAPFPRQFYTALQLSAFVIMLVIHWRHPRFVGHAFWIFPGFFFWLYYRGLFNYWIYWMPPLLLALTYRATRGAILDTKRSSSWRGTAALAASLLVLNLLWGAVYFLRRPPMDISYSLPLEVIDYGEKLVDRLQVTVTNTGDTDLAPRFAVQRDPGVQALPWVIDSGPERLQPGRSGAYAIHAGVPIRAFLVKMGGQIVVTDAGGDYWQRAVQTIPPDKSFAYPDAIVNPEFKFWPAGGNAPEAWALQTTLGDSATAGLGLVEGQSGLTVQLDKESTGGDLAIARLAQTIPFLEEFAVWVYPTAPATDPRQRAYGLELDDGEHKLWVLFGDSGDQGELGKDWSYIYLPAPLNTWSRHVIRPRKLYDSLGWQVPSFSLRRRNGLEYLARQTQLSLLVASQSRSSGIFGPLEQENPASASDGLVSEALAHPDVYYINLGSEYRRQRNYDLAQDAYREALARDAASAEAHFGLAGANFWRDDWSGAIEAFEASIRYGYHQPALVYRGLGWSYYNLDELVEAKRAFEKAILLAPDLADGYNGLGWVVLRENRCDEAVRYFEQALALDPSFPEPQQGIEKCAELE